MIADVRRTLFENSWRSQRHMFGASQGILGCAWPSILVCNICSHWLVGSYRATSGELHFPSHTYCLFHVMCSRVVVGRKQLER